ECEANGEVMTHHIELKAAFTPSPSFPAPTAPERNIRPKGVIRPALVGDPMLLSESELLQRGYPPRPDQEKAPEAYAAWLRAVSRPSVQVTPKVILRADRFHGPAKIANEPNITNDAFNNWCGYANETNGLGADNSPFNWVMGEWIVPAVVPEPLNNNVFTQ